MRRAPRSRPSTICQRAQVALLAFVARKSPHHREHVHVALVGGELWSRCGANFILLSLPPSSTLDRVSLPSPGVRISPSFARLSIPSAFIVFLDEKLILSTHQDYFKDKPRCVWRPLRSNSIGRKKTRQKQDRAPLSHLRLIPLLVADVSLCEAQREVMTAEQVPLFVVTWTQAVSKAARSKGAFRFDFFRTIQWRPRVGLHKRPCRRRPTATNHMYSDPHVALLPLAFPAHRCRTL
jgi:hypothetical protein